MPALSILIKPASGLCNMRCGYCFYSDVADHRAVRSYGIMSEETAENLIRRAFEYAEGSVSLAFQGGEPTLAGTEYFRMFIRLVGEHNKNNLPVSYSIQTNGLDISDEMLALWKEYHFLVLKFYSFLK